MSTRKIFSSTVFMLFSRIFFRVMNALIGILLARFLGVEAFGQYAAIIAFVNLFMVFNDLGVSRLSLLEGSRDKGKLGYLLGNGLLIEVILSLILYVLMIAVGKTIGYSGIMIELLVILAIAELLFESRKIYQSTLQSLTKFNLISWQQIIYAALFFILVLTAVFIKPEVKVVAYLQLIVSALMFVIYLLFVFRYIKPVIKLNEIAPLLKKSWIFCISSVFFIIYFQIATVLLSVMKTETDVGYYSAIYRLVVAFYMIPQIIFQILLPYIYQFSLENKEKFSRITHTIQKYLLALAVPLTVLFWLGAKPLIQLIYGQSYLPAVLACQIISFVLIIRFFTYSSAESITAINKQKIRATIEGITAGLNIGLNILLIPKYSYVGSAIATLISELILGVLFYLYIENYFRQGLLKSLKYFLPTIGSGIVMSFVFFLFTTKFHLIFTLSVSFLTYLAALYLFKFLSNYDLKLMREMLPWFNRKKAD